MGKTQHLVLTRFNLRHAEWEHDCRGDAVLTKEWMDHRFPLFDRFCFPSMMGQTNRDFTWLVAFDEDTHADYRPLIDAYRERFALFTPLYSARARFIDDILLHVDADTEFLITTRIDNDDAFHKDAVATIQSEFREQEFEFLNLLQGYFLYPDRIDYLQADCNMFVSLVERRGAGQPFTTVFGCGRHTNLRQRGPVRQVVTSRPSWLHVIHDRNQSDTGQPGPRRGVAVELIQWALGMGRELRAHLHRRGRSPYDQPVEVVRTTPLRFEEICAEFSLTECGPL